jgi:leucyl aminopeptidase
MQTLLDEKPETLSIGVFGSVDERRSSAARAVQCAWLNGPALPARKKKGPPAPLAKIVLHGAALDAALPRLAATAEGNQLCRELTLLPPNELTPGLYRDRVRELAREHGWEVEEFDLKRLRRMGAGAFVAVAQGSAEEDAAIVRLRRRRRGRRPTVALVGKGICFDTGGHNLKSAQYMHGMHKDMNGSAVTLGLLLAATKADAPVNIDAWLAIAQNHIGPRAYKQNDVVTALDGTTIEIVHTDAEGRMVLADALTLAVPRHPDAQRPVVGQDRLAVVAVAMVGGRLGLLHPRGVAQVVAHLGAQGAFDQGLLECSRGVFDRLCGHRTLDQLVKELRRDLGQHRRLRGSVGLLDLPGWLSYQSTRYASSTNFLTGST